MILYLFYFFISFLGDYCAYFFYQRYVDSHKKDVSFLIYAIVSAIAVWFFIFKLQDRGQILRVFIPIWSAGTAIFGYFAGGYASGTPTKELFNMQAIICVLAIGVSIYFLNRIVTP
jgi:hypothetical protein